MVVVVITAEVGELSEAALAVVDGAFLKGRVDC